jgi:hypothetical protein
MVTVSRYIPGATQIKYRLVEELSVMLLSAFWIDVKSPPDLATTITLLYGVVGALVSPRWAANAGPGAGTWKAELVSANAEAKTRTTQTNRAGSRTRTVEMDTSFTVHLLCAWPQVMRHM